VSTGARPISVSRLATRSRHAGARARLVELTDRGVAAIEGGRRHRAALAGELSSQLGGQRVEAARRVLVDVVRELGGEGAVGGRRVRPPR
jgi:DNA-binding MarR family transcriptional regulator